MGRADQPRVPKGSPGGGQWTSGGGGGDFLAQFSPNYGHYKGYPVGVMTPLRATVEAGRIKDFLKDVEKYAKRNELMPPNKAPKRK